MDELPEVWERLLGADEIDALLDDLDAQAHVLDVLVKAGPGQRADPRPVALREAAAALLAGSVRGIQIRYLFEGTEWRDTLLATPQGVRAVRLRLPTGG